MSNTKFKHKMKSLLRGRCKQRGMSVHHLETALGVPAGSYENFIRSSTKNSFLKKTDVLLKLCMYFDLDLTDLLDPNQDVVRTGRTRQSTTLLHMLGRLKNNKDSEGFGAIVGLVVSHLTEALAPSGFILKAAMLTSAPRGALDVASIEVYTLDEESLTSEPPAYILLAVDADGVVRIQYIRHASEVLGISDRDVLTVSYLKSLAKRLIQNKEETYAGTR